MTLYVCLIEKVINNILLGHFFETKGLWWIRETNLEQSVYNVIAPSGVTLGRQEEKLMFAKVENAKGKEVTYSELYLRYVCITNKNWGTFLCNIYWDNMPITVMIFCYAWKVLNLVLENRCYLQTLLGKKSDTSCQCLVKHFMLFQLNLWIFWDLQIAMS